MRERVNAEKWISVKENGEIDREKVIDEQERKLPEPPNPCPPGIAITADKICYTCGNCGEPIGTICSAKVLFNFGNYPQKCSKCGCEVKWK